jgi:HlyD family secretion protein
MAKFQNTLQRFDVGRSIARHVLFGLCALVLIGGGFALWATMAQLSGAVIASGTLVVDSNVKKVQHPTGGVIGELRVKEGDHVEAGQILVKLDETQTRANLAVLVNAINELLAREARLDAERTGANEISFPDQLLAQRSDVVVEKVLGGEKKHFELRREARNGQKQQLQERAAQLVEQIGGLNTQISAKDAEVELVIKELGGIRQLWEKQLVPISKLTALEREAARLGGEKGQLVAAVAEAKGKIAEVQQQIIQIDQDMRSQGAQELAEVRAKLSELTERKIAAEDLLRRVDIRSPQTGTVHELAVHTIGGTVAPGEPIMLIVPDNDLLTVEAKVSPTDIAQLHLDQLAELRFSAFNSRVTPELSGHVTRVAPDITQDQRGGASYYVVRVGIDSGELEKLKGLKFVPGMPVEVFVQTPPRSMISYLLKPLRDQAVRALRES